MTPREEAQRLINTIRVGMGGRICIEDWAGMSNENRSGIFKVPVTACKSVVAETRYQDSELPADILEALPRLKPQLLDLLSEIRDPEYRAYRAFVSAWGVSKYKSLALMLAGFRQRLHGGE